MIRIWSRRSRRAVPTHSSACAFAFGARGGILITSVPAAANTASNAAVNLASWSRTRNRNRWECSSRAISRFRTCWVVPTSVGLAVIPASCTRRPSPRSGSHTRASPPAGRAGTASTSDHRAGGWPQPMPAQDRPHRGRRDADSELAALPTIRRYPQRGFSRDNRSTSSTTSGSRPRPPGRREPGSV